MILVPASKVEKIKYFSTLLGLIFIEITRGPFPVRSVRALPPCPPAVTALVSEYL